MKDVLFLQVVVRISNLMAFDLRLKTNVIEPNTKSLPNNYMPQVVTLSSVTSTSISNS